MFSDLCITRTMCVQFAVLSRVGWHSLLYDSRTIFTIGRAMVTDRERSAAGCGLHVASYRARRWSAMFLGLSVRALFPPPPSWPGPAAEDVDKFAGSISNCSCAITPIFEAFFFFPLSHTCTTSGCVAPTYFMKEIGRLLHVSTVDRVPLIDRFIRTCRPKTAPNCSPRASPLLAGMLSACSPCPGPYRANPVDPATPMMYVLLRVESRPDLVIFRCYTSVYVCVLVVLLFCLRFSIL